MMLNRVRIIRLLKYLYENIDTKLLNGLRSAHNVTLELHDKKV